MPRQLDEIFNEHPGVEVIDFVSYNDDGPFGLSCDGRKLKIGHDPAFAKELATLEGAGTETGFITEEGYYIYGHSGYITGVGVIFSASVYRLPPKERTV
jgi:hypothetical protein